MEMEKITAEEYQKNPTRYTVVAGNEDGAPTCTYGHVQTWVGYDKELKQYVRFTKSVFLRLVREKEKDFDLKK